jgi:hypothetical protein
VVGHWAEDTRQDIRSVCLDERPFRQNWDAFSLLQRAINNADVNGRVPASMIGAHSARLGCPLLRGFAALGTRTPALLTDSPRAVANTLPACPERRSPGADRVLGLHSRGDLPLGSAASCHGARLGVGIHGMIRPRERLLMRFARRIEVGSRRSSIAVGVCA